MMTEKFWAKTGKGDFCEGSPQYHPVICHLADTAAVAMQIVGEYLSDAAIATLERGLGLKGKSLVKCCGFLAGCHDLGKVSPAFQFQVSEVGKALVGEHLYDLWTNLPAEVRKGKAKARDKISFLYFEHCRIEQDDRAIAIVKEKDKFFVPCASIATLLLGPGTSITHAAIKTLYAENACEVHWVGEDVLRFYASGRGSSGNTERLLQQVKLRADRANASYSSKRFQQVRVLIPHRLEAVCS